VVSSPIIRSTYNCIYSIWYLLTITAICLYCGRFGASPIIRSTYNCIYSIWYLLRITAICMYCGRFDAGLSVVVSLRLRPAPTLPQQRQIAVMVNNYQILIIVICAPDDGWRYHPKHVEQFSRNK